MSADDNKFDGLLMTIMQQQKDINLFFDSVYGFLRRQTDFFADQKAAEGVIVGQCKKHFTQYLVDKQEKDEKEAKRREREEQRKREKEAEAAVQKPQAQPVKVQKPVEIPVEQQIEQKQAGEGDKKEDDEKAPVGNGGKTDQYIWTQTLEEVQVFVPIPKEITSKQLIVKIETGSLLVQIKGQEPIIQGQFFEQIQSEESIWTITDGEIQDYKGKYIHIQLEKWTAQMHWWSSVIKGHATINTQKINPEPSKLSDLDGETRSTVDKMMFDMRQKQAGLPSSDELQKKDKLQQFMKQHPEMDFSKAKFN